MEDDDVLDKIMPNDPETSGADDIEILIADDAEDETPVPGEGKEHQGDTSTEDGGGRIEDTEDLSSDDRGLSKNVQDRIRREIRLRKTERDMRLAAEAAAARSNSDKLDAQLITYTVLSKGIESQITVLTEKLLQAKESGQTKEEIDLQSKLNEQQVNLREANSAYQRIEQEKRSPKVVVNEEANRWLARNKWYSDAEFDVEAAGVKAIDRRLTGSKRFDPRSPEFFSELDRQIKERFPNLLKKAASSGMLIGEYDEPTRRVIKQPVGNVGVRQASTQNQPIRNRSQYTFSKSDFENMRRYRLDPNNKAHLQAYAREKMGQREE